MDRNGGGAGARRPAPPPPASKQSSYGSIRTSQTSVNKSKCSANGTGKETVIVVQRSKTAKRMPLLMKKLKINKNPARPSPARLYTASGDIQTSSAGANGSSRDLSRTDANNSGGSNANRRSIGAASLLKYSNSRSSYRDIQSRPMIIRPGSNQLAKKKSAPPPRPPPPTISKSQTDSRGPPSYDEVLRADLNAFMGEAKAPRPKPKAPARPASMFSISSAASTSRQNDLLIDFDAPPTSSVNRTVKNGANQLPKISLLDMDLFTGPSVNSALMNGGAVDAGLSAKHIQRSSSYTFDGPSDPWNAAEYSIVPRRGSNPCKWGGPLRGDDWLQSCLRDSVNGTLGHGDGFTGFNGISMASSPPPPPLPPRPRVFGHGSPANASSARIELFESEGDLESPSSPSPEPPMSTPPPVPPLPADDVDVLTFQLEGDDDEISGTMPPLPPRPTLCNASRPHAVALYDYAATQGDDLYFSAGDVVMLVHQVNDEWLYGIIGEREGVFPKNFVDVVVPLNGDRAAKQNDCQVEGSLCCAIYDFVGENDGELSFGVGDVLSLMERVGSDWFRGTLCGGGTNRAVGLFPVSFVEVLNDQPFEECPKVASGPSRTSNNPQLCVAIYNFTGEPGELSFSEGDKIELTGVVNDDWLMGRKLVAGSGDVDNGDQTAPLHGRFPKAFVQNL